MRHIGVTLTLIPIILAWMMGVSEAQQDTLLVPQAIEEISAAIDSAGVGDLVLVSNNSLPGNPPYAPITMKTGVTVQRKAGHTPKISADGGSRAVAFPLNADTSTILDGFTILGGDTTVVMRYQGVMRNCTIDSDNDATAIGVYHAVDEGTIEHVTVRLDNTGTTSTGIFLLDSEATVRNCDVRVINASVGSNYGIKAELFDLNNTLDPRIDSTFVSVPEGSGIDAEAGSLFQCTVDTSYYVGIYDSGGGTTIHNCLVGSTGGTGIDGVAANVSYCIAPSFSLFGGSGTGNSTDDPLFCDAGAAEYTLRVDSYGNENNNASNQTIGAFPVACIYGTLERDAEFSGNGTLDFPGDATVPSNKTLTLGSGTLLDVAGSDDQSGGYDTEKVELIVKNNGMLDINGSAGNKVEFRSNEASPTEGDWYGVYVETGGDFDITYADFQHATTALVNKTKKTTSITNSTFSNNEIRDIIAGAPTGASMPFTASDNTLTVDSGIGVELSSVVSGVTIQDNTFYGDSLLSSAGISIEQFTANETPLLVGNTISGFETGAGIRTRFTDSKATMKTNVISDCKYGINLHYASPKIGLSSESGSDNIIKLNTWGVYCDSTSAPLIRNNQILNNTYGVLAIHSSTPDLGDTTSSIGNNTLTGNSTYCIWNRNTSGTLKAHGNYFGNPGGCPFPSCTNGSVEIDNWLCSEPAGVSWDMVRVPERPSGFRLLGASPNPMTSEGKIFFSLDEGIAAVRVQIFDVRGRLVRSFGEFEIGPGDHHVHWDARDGSGVPVRRGIYFIRVVGDNGIREAAKLLLTR